ncbi:MAG: hypothetical protein IKR57_01145 [Bacilli bacterium]|nr:hypothetical protein [Bacilli bacterium]
MNEELDREIKKGNCVPGINYISIYNDDKSREIYEVYLKNENEYKVVGIWHCKGNKLGKYSKGIYDELKRQGMYEPGCMFMALEVKNKEEYDKFMNYLISIRDKEVSYTDVYMEKSKIIKYDFSKANRIKIDQEQLNKE